jgi:hypothetical protein
MKNIISIIVISIIIIIGNDARQSVLGCGATCNQSRWGAVEAGAVSYSYSR